MVQPKVSIIVPVYKVEKYIEKCVCSLFGQTLDNLEYIFVDDCSPDKSIATMLKILEEFPERKPQVKIIRHTINKGVSQSRQDGLDAATGEYIIHCDPDDWIELNMYELLYEKARETDADVVICDYYSVNGDIVTYYTQEPQELSSISILESISGLNSKRVHGGLWNKLIKEGIAHNAQFQRGISWSEDFCYLLSIFKEKLKIDYLNYPLYNYRHNPEGLDKTFSKDALNKDIYLINYLKKIEDESDNKRYKACCKARVIITIYYRFVRAQISVIKHLNRIPFHYQIYIFKNHKINILGKLQLFLSVNGFYKEAKLVNNIYKRLFL